MTKKLCKIDKHICVSKIVNVRSKKKLRLFYCKKCDFEFFVHNPKKNLERNKLDVSRLKKVGMKIPRFKEDFQNGVLQSKIYIKKYLDKRDKKKNILEVGCSWGYFLNLVKKHGSFPYGLEINSIRSRYVRNRLKIRCENNIEKYEKEEIKFDKIFLFYVLEYIPDPVKYLARLFKLLRRKGSIIIYTTNKNDVLKDVLKNKEYINFFYDENSVNYFSKKSLIHLIKKLKIKKYKIKSDQGYSFVNFLNWFLNKRPSKTGMVGGDNYVNHLVNNLSLLNTIRKRQKNKFNQARKNLIKLFKKTEVHFKKILMSSNIENQLILKIYK